VDEVGVWRMGCGDQEKEVEGKGRESKEKGGKNDFYYPIPRRAMRMCR
jgi:hypothetical protein